MKKLNFSIGILSWKGYESLKNSLESYSKNGLNNLTESRYICLPEYNQEGINISKKYNYKPILFNRNIGILNGFKELAKKMPDGPLLLLENDLPIVENQKITFSLINESISNLYDYKAAQIRLRSISDPGDPFHAIEKYKRYWAKGFFQTCRRFFRPSKATRMIGTAAYFEKYPNIKHPRYIKKLKNGSFLMTSKIINWSNLAILVDKKFFLNTIVTEAEKTKTSKNINGFKNIEIEMNKRWWRDKNWNIIVTRGLFKHERLSDRGY